MKAERTYANNNNATQTTARKFHLCKGNPSYSSADAHRADVHEHVHDAILLQLAVPSSFRSRDFMTPSGFYEQRLLGPATATFVYMLHAA